MNLKKFTTLFTRYFFLCRLKQILIFFISNIEMEKNFQKLKFVDFIQIFTSIRPEC